MNIDETIENKTAMVLTRGPGNSGVYVTRYTSGYLRGSSRDILLSRNVESALCMVDSWSMNEKKELDGGSEGHVVMDRPRRLIPRRRRCCNGRRRREICVTHKWKVSHAD